MNSLRCRCGSWTEWDETEEEPPAEYECADCRRDRLAAESEDAEDARQESLRERSL